MPQRVLLIDDSPDIHVQVRLLLAGEPIDVVTAESAADGFAAARRQVPDLFLLDVDLPDTNGYEVCRMLKTDAHLAAVPVVFLTGLSTTEEKVRGLNLGAVDYVAKPFDPAELRARVSAALRTKYLFDLLGRRAMIDGLTGLWNRTYFDRRLRAELSAARRHGRPLAGVLVDVDRFKQVNAAHGHPAGDHVLRGVGDALASAARAEDVVAYFGNAAFAVLAPSVPDHGAATLAERMRHAVQCQRFAFRGSQISVTASFGVAEAAPPLPDAPPFGGRFAPADDYGTDRNAADDQGAGDVGSGHFGSGDVGSGDVGSGDVGSGDVGSGDLGPAAAGTAGQASALLDRADFALYQAKRAGRNRVVVAAATAVAA